MALSPRSRRRQLAKKSSKLSPSSVKPQPAKFSESLQSSPGLPSRPLDSSKNKHVTKQSSRIVRIFWLCILLCFLIDFLDGELSWSYWVFLVVGLIFVWYKLHGKRRTRHFQSLETDLYKKR